jgi:hypothetical protein
VFPPGLVTDLELSRDELDIMATWKNPSDADFDRVRVVRNTRFFPESEVDGWVVYEGDGNRARDEGAIALGERLYYSVFSYDRDGNISAGAVASWYLDREDEGTYGTTTEDTSTSPLSFAHLEWYQDGARVMSASSTVSIDGGRHLTVAIPYDTVPEHLKTILVHIVPTDAPETMLRFILRVNKDKTAYTARLAPLGVDGRFTVTVHVFDYTYARITTFQGALVSLLGGGHVQDDVPPLQRGRFSERIEYWHIVTLLFFVLMCIVALGYVLAQRRGTERDSGVGRLSK